MSNIISVNITKRNSRDMSSTAYGFDPSDIISPIRNNGLVTYFTTRELRGMDTDGRNNAQVSWESSDSLTTIAGSTSDFILLTVLFRDAVRNVDMKSEKMVFDTNKMMESLVADANTGGTRILYEEDGNPQPMLYIVQETIAQIAAATSNPITNFNGRDLYVNDIQGNNATAQKGDPLRPWLTADAAIIAAGAGDTVVLLEGNHTIGLAGNPYKAGVNIEVRTNAVATFTNYTASGVGNSTIYGGGKIIFNTNSGLNMDSTFDGVINVNIGTFEAQKNIGVINASANKAILNVVCDFSKMDANCQYLVKNTGTGTFNWKTNVSHSDKSTQKRNTFLIAPTALVGITEKNFEIKIASGNCTSANEAMVLLVGTDDTYIVNADISVTLDTTAGTHALDAIIAAYNCTGGHIYLKGHNDINLGRLAILVNSAVKFYDHSTTYSSPSEPKAMILMAGGTSVYNYYGVKLSYSHIEAIRLGAFTGANNTVDFGAISATGGQDVLNFKGGLNCPYNAGVHQGILVSDANGGLIIDGGSIEMDNAGNDAISAAAPHNIRVYGTGFVKGAVNANITNIVAGSNIISDANVTVKL